MNWLANKIRGWRTVIINAMFAVVPFLLLPEVQAVVPSEYLAYYSLFVAVVNMYLRSITKTPIGKKNAE